MSRTPRPRRAAALLAAACAALAAGDAAADAASTACQQTVVSFSETFAGTALRDPRSSVAGWGGGAGVTLSAKAGAFPNASLNVQFGERVYAVATGDFNGDGRDDAVVASDAGGSCHLDFFVAGGGGTPTRVGQVASCTDTTAAALAAGDVDNDGLLDFVYATVVAPNQAGTVATAKLWHNTGVAAGTPSFAALDLATTLQAAAVSWHAGGSPLVLADWNGDGRADLLALSSSGSSDQVLMFASLPGFGLAATPLTVLGDAGLTPPFASATSPATGGYACPPAVGRGGTALAVADFNSDGRPDLIAAGPSDANVRYFTQNADGTLYRNPDLAGLAGGPLWAAARDIDGDGSVDVVVGVGGNDCGGPPALVAFFFNDGQGGLAYSPRTLNLGGVLQFVGVLDSDGDGTQDVLAGKLTGVGSATYSQNTPATALFNPNSLALSRSLAQLDPRAAGIVSLSVAAGTSYSVPPGAALLLSVSNDGGQSWEPLTASELAGTPHTFTHFGSDLRWRAQLSAPPTAPTGVNAPYTPAAQVTPRLTRLALSYSTVGPHVYTRSGLAQGSFVSGGGNVQMLYSAAFTYPGFAGQLFGYDIGRLAPGTTASGSLARVDTDSAVTLRWEAGAQLAARSGATRTLYTAYPNVTYGTDQVTVQTRRIPLSAAEAASGSSTPSLASMMGIAQLDVPTRSALLAFLTGGMGDPNGTKLADPGHSSPAFVGAPAADPTSMVPAGYAAFQAAQAARAPRVYLGDNAGVLHAFDAATGAEAWGFVPYNLLAKLKTQQALDPNGRPTYRHGTFVDGSITVQDVYAQSAWRTVLLVGQAQGQGLQGNNYYFALDVTDPSNPQPLWEFSDVWSAPRPACSLANNAAYSCAVLACGLTSSCRPECSPYDSLFNVGTTAPYRGAIEAEHFDNLRPAPSGASWNSQAGPLVGAGGLFTAPNSSRGGYEQASTGYPTCAAGSTAAVASCAQLSYRVSVPGGTFYPYFRVYPTGPADSTVAYGIDGAYAQTLTAPSPVLGVNPSNNWYWLVGSAVTLAAGQHEIELWMNQAGARVDTLVLQSSLLTPPDAVAESCSNDCRTYCQYSGCAATTYSSPSTTAWPQCGAGNQLQCCGVAGGDQYCAPTGTSCPAAESVSGETWSEPALGPVKVGGGSKWVAFFASGYNNRPAAANVGRALYAVDAYSGQLMMQWNFGDIPAGATNPSTLANAVPGGVSVVDTDGDGFIDRVYVGDLEGRLWKVDTFASASVNSSGLMTNPNAYPSCVLFDAGDPNQSGQRIWAPVVTRPASTVLVANTAHVYFGTGGDDAAPDSQLYKFYGIYDDDGRGSCRTTPKTEPGLSAAALEWVVGDGRRVDGSPLTTPSDEGTAGDRFWSDPVIANGESIYFASLPGKIESVDPCVDLQGVSKIYGYGIRTFTDAAGTPQRAGQSLFGGGRIPWVATLGKVRRAALVRNAQPNATAHGASTPPPAAKTDVFLQSFAGTGGAGDTPAIQRLTEGGTAVKGKLRLLRWREVPL